MPPLKIAIIGGGFSGTALARNLLQQAKIPLNIYLIERRSRFGRGVAYGTENPWHLLNVPASNMSALKDDPLHFLHWMQSNAGQFSLESIGPGSFAPRMVYASYLNALLKEGEALALKGVVLHRIHDEAISLKLQKGNADILLKSGKHIDAARVVMAVGNFSPAPVLNGTSSCNSHHYIADPWSSNLDFISSNDAVLLIGSGLTMIDVAVSLKKRGHRGIIYVVSRHGLLPQAHQPIPSFDPENIKNIPKTVRALLHWLRTNAKQRDDWRQAIDSIRSATPKVWRSLNLKEKKRFLRHLRPYWDIHRHRMAPEIAKIIEDMRASGQMVIVPARIYRLNEFKDFIEVSFSKRHSINMETLRAAVAINCTGPQSDLQRIDDPLISNLFKQELVRPDLLGLGLDTDAHGALINSKGKVSKALFTLGSTLKGLLWETIAVPELRVQASDLSKILLRR